MSYIVAVAACALDKIFEIYTFNRLGGLAKNYFWLVATQKKRIGEQITYFWNMRAKPFSWAKSKRKLFSDGRSWGPLLARAALNTYSRVGHRRLFIKMFAAPPPPPERPRDLSLFLSFNTRTHRWRSSWIRVSAPNFYLSCSSTTSCVGRLMICRGCRFYFSGLVCSVLSLN